MRMKILFVRSRKRFIVIVNKTDLRATIDMETCSELPREICY